MVANGLHYNTLRGVDLLMVRPANAVGLLVLVESLVETLGRRQHVRTGRDDPSLDVRELRDDVRFPENQPVLIVRQAHAPDGQQVSLTLVRARPATWSAYDSTQWWPPGKPSRNSNCRQCQTDAPRGTLLARLAGRL